MIQSCYSAIQRHKVCEVIGRFTIVSKLCIRTSDSSLRTGAFRPMPISMGYTASSVMDTLNLGMYKVSLAVQVKSRGIGS